MTISSSLNAGVAGLNANANRLATISDNIANSQTFGYKRAQADFYSMVIRGDTTSNYTAGGVRSTNMRLIDERGPLIATNNATDLAIDGRGFLLVTSMESLSDNSSSYDISLATTGSFRPDQNGIMRTAAGQVLMGWPANADGQVPEFPRDSTAGLTPVIFNANQYVANPTTSVTLGLNLPATGTTFGSTFAPKDYPVEYFGNLGTSETLNFNFTPTIPATSGDPPSNEWTLEVTDTASGGAVIGVYTLTFDNSQADGGKLASVTTVSGGAYDPATGMISSTVGGGSIDIFIGKPLTSNGLTQLSDTFAPVSVSKDGSPVASLISVKVDTGGNLYAVYDQGFTRLIYKLPVADVPNPNGLISLNNQTYTVSPDSGPYYLWDAGSGPTGSVVGFAREESTTDIAQELTALITTQRAYSSNAKVIQTVDEMLQETTNIKR
ncbi:MAG: flagellar hook-basal body complex protein [Rhodobacteraceae bacterium]|nr:flagellar hook-basal body complex protein [Paracoccaceae bacterium]